LTYKLFSTLHSSSGNLFKKPENQQKLEKFFTDFYTVVLDKQKPTILNQVKWLQETVKMLNRTEIDWFNHFQIIDSPGKCLFLLVFYLKIKFCNTKV
jgi:hypothetical protein